MATDTDFEVHSPRLLHAVMVLAEHALQTRDIPRRVHQLAAKVLSSDASFAERKAAMFGFLIQSGSSLGYANASMVAIYGPHWEKGIVQ